MQKLENFKIVSKSQDGKRAEIIINGETKHIEKISSHTISMCVEPAVFVDGIQKYKPTFEVFQGTF